MSVGDSVYSCGKPGCDNSFCINCEDDHRSCGDCAEVFCSLDCYTESHTKCPVEPNEYHCTTLNNIEEECDFCGIEICTECNLIGSDYFVASPTTYGCLECRDAGKFTTGLKSNFKSQQNQQSPTVICECGEDKVNPNAPSRSHSNWCPKYKP